MVCGRIGRVERERRNAIKIKSKQQSRKKVHVLHTLSSHEYASSCHAATTGHLDMEPLQRVPEAIRVSQPHRSEVTDKAG